MRNLLTSSTLYFWRGIKKNPTLRHWVVKLARPALPTLRRMIFGARYIDYDKWIKNTESKLRIDASTANHLIDNLHYKPLITIVMPCYETPQAFFREAIASVQKQHYRNWELCIVDDASPSDCILPIIKPLMMTDPRIRATRRQENGHISAASNTGLAMARGEWIVLMDHDDTLDESALLEILLEINRHPKTQIVYTDEDNINAKVGRFNPFFKPDFDPDLLLGQNMVNHLGAYRRDLLVSIGGFREGFEGSQDHDLILRASAVCGAQAVRHIPSILYHWRQQTEHASFSETFLEKCLSASRRAVTDHLNEKGINASISPAPLAPIYHRITFPVPMPAPKVSIIIPTRDRAYLLKACVEGILHRTDYQNLDILIADNGSTEKSSLELFQRLQNFTNIQILSLPGPFNYSRLNNQAASRATGDILLLLNNDTDVISPNWLTELVSLAIRPEIGAVGPKLLYKNDTVQHAGVVLGMGWPGGVAGHYALGAPRDEPGPFGSLALLRSVSAVTGACLAVRRELYNAVGGLDEDNLSVAYNDVDFCLRLREQGYRNLWTPFAELYHFESVSRGDDLTGEKLIRFQKETQFMRQRWGDLLDEDPYWNPHLSLNTLGRDIALESRRLNKWSVSK